MDLDAKQLQRVWNQWRVPVILRRGGKGERVRLRLPYSLDNGSWLRGGHNKLPEWIPEGRYWETPKAWFNDIVNRSLDRYGHVYVVQPYRKQEKCAPACMNAKGHECECSCMGANHGLCNDGSWFEVSDTFATRWGDMHLACRLMTVTV